uniref:(northern house mosquito) hypothetical protein n=1 Tax=Culex pipiens TaxID=7175 RepID=A0A8D8B0F6_CULPI
MMTMKKNNCSIVTLPFGAVVTIVVGRSRGGVRRTWPFHVVVIVADQLLDGVVWILHVNLVVRDPVVRIAVDVGNRRGKRIQPLLQLRLVWVALEVVVQIADVDAVVAANLAVQSGWQPVTVYANGVDYGAVVQVAVGKQRHGIVRPDRHERVIFGSVVPIVQRVKVQILHDAKFAKVCGRFLDGRSGSVKAHEQHVQGSVVIVVNW